MAGSKAAGVRPGREELSCCLTPAAIVVRASWPDEKVVTTTVGRLAVDLEATGARMTALVLVGDALRGAGARSHLYSPGYAHSYRRRSTAGTTTGRPA